MKDSSNLSKRTGETIAELSRRGFLGHCVSSVAIIDTTALPAWAELPITEVAYNRMSKAAAHYQWQPNRKQHCAVCKHFRAPGSCEIVTGKISPHGWYRYFRAGRGPAAGSSGGSY